jgi:hypothetical protein
MKAIDDELSWRKPAAGKSAHPESLAGGSPRGQLLDVEGKTAMLFTIVVVVEGLGWRRSTVSGRHGKKQNGTDSERERRRKRKWSKEGDCKEAKWERSTPQGVGAGIRAVGKMVVDGKPWQPRSEWSQAHDLKRRALTIGSHAV